MKLFCAPLTGRNGSETAHALLSYAYRKEFGKTVPEIARTPNGKPYFPKNTDVHFSLSHTGTHVLCALACSPVGADIESPRHISERVMRFFCSPEELALFDPLDLWVLKESYVKLLGETVALIRKTRFSMDNGRIIAPDESVISRLYRIGNCHAAVSGKGAEPPDSIELISLDIPNTNLKRV